jgi:acyl-CoA thioesterase FadM
MDVALDPSHFTPLQLQPRGLVYLGFNAGVRWMRDCTMSHRRVVKQLHVGFVLYGVHLEYLDPLRYGETDTLTVTSVGHVRHEGAQLENLVDYTSEGRTVAHLQTISVPLWLEDSDESAGVPATMSPELLSLYRPDEFDPTPYRCPVVPLAEEAAASGRLLGQHEERITLHRHQCEVADQWFFVEVLGFCGASRESLVREHGRAKPELRKGLSLPLQKVDLLFTRPVFLFDTVVVQTQAYAIDERLTFVHRLVGAEGDVLHSTVVERL